jgi:hypothetical protein
VDENQLPEAGNTPSLWTISEVRGTIEHQVEEPSTINEEDLFEKDKAKAPDPVKKKKTKSRKTSNESIDFYIECIKLKLFNKSSCLIHI